MKRIPATSALVGIALVVFALSTPGTSADDNSDKARELLDFGNKARTGGALIEARENFTPQNGYHLGRAVAARIVDQYGVLDDDEATRYVNRVGHSLAFGANHPYVYSRYRFIILDTDESHAFAVPGAYVFISRGMLRYTIDEDTLAAILAHEIAHIKFDHGIKSIKDKRWKRLLNLAIAHGFGDLAGKTLGDFSAILGNLAGDYFETLSIQGYEKTQNSSADRWGVAFLANTGYDSSAMLDVLRAMKRHRAKGTFAKTHPSPSNRIKEVKATKELQALRKMKEPRDRPDVRRERFCAALGHLIEVSTCSASDRG